jgi:hypothetical protein
MPVAATEAPRLSDEQVAEMLALTKDADSVELKLTVEAGPAVRALDLDPLEAQVRQVYFFDTPDLTLNKAGVVVRARRIQGKGDDSVVKLRPVVPHELPAELRASPGFGVEVDAMPGGFVCSGSLKAAHPSAPVRQAIRGELPRKSMFTRSSGPSMPSVPPRASSSRISACSARSSSSRHAPCRRS